MKTVMLERHGLVTEIVLNRPDKLNAFNAALFQELGDAFDTLQSDDTTSVVLIRGEGRAFSVGWDVGPKPKPEGPYSAKEREPAHADWLRLRDQVGVFTRAFQFPVPVIAAVHGFCMGGATLIPSCADLAVVGAETKIAWPVLPIGGGMLGPAAMYSVGPKKAKELSFTAGSHMMGPEAESRGWANYCVPEEDVLARARSLAHEVSKTPRDMLEIKKLAANDVLIRQGFLETINACATWDALIHTAPGNVRMATTLKDKGIKAARQWYDAGPHPLDDHPAAD